MKIVMFSVNPIFPQRVTGGASKHLYQIARYLGEAGHQIEIFCTQPETGSMAFTWAKNVRVFPELPFHLPFPQPYAISGAALSQIVQQLARALENADRLYIHDGEFLIPDVYRSIPTVISFRDNIYPESVLGTFIGKADDVICVSSFSKAVIEYTAGRFFPGLNERIHLVRNGFDLNEFKPVETQILSIKLGVDPTRELILLHPHRPEPGKGLAETIQVVKRLVFHHGLSQVKVLIPEWIDSMVSESESGFYHKMMGMMDDLDVREFFQFIPWLSQEDMPALYSLAEVTLCLGNIVEAFGNVAYESLACGTPSIVARVGVHRTLMPDELIDKVDYGDIESAADRIAAIHGGRKTDMNATFDYFRANMDRQQQVESYAAIIENCKKRKSLTFSLPPSDPKQGYRLAPWCYLNGGRIYHDFEGIYDQDTQFGQLIAQYDTITQEIAIAFGITPEKWESWINRSWLVPARS